MTGESDKFSLDARLAADTAVIGDLPLSRLLLMNDARWPWLILVPRRPAISEIIELSREDRSILMDEISACSALLKTLAAPHKINVAALGNVVRQLHIHVLARFLEDPAWPKPVFGFETAVPYDPQSRDMLAVRIREGLHLSAPAG